MEGSAGKSIALASMPGDNFGCLKIEASMPGAYT